MELRFGAMSDPIGEQVPDLTALESEWFQRLADAITLLSVQSLLSEKEVYLARKRLVKRIARHMKAKTKRSSK